MKRPKLHPRAKRLWCTFHHVSRHPNFHRGHHGALALVAGIDAVERGVSVLTFGIAATVAFEIVAFINGAE